MGSPPPPRKIVGLKLCWLVVSIVSWGRIQNFSPLGPFFLTIPGGGGVGCGWGVVIISYKAISVQSIEIELDWLGLSLAIGKIESVPNIQKKCGVSDSADYLQILNISLWPDQCWWYQTHSVSPHTLDNTHYIIVAELAQHVSSKHWLPST